MQGSAIAPVGGIKPEAKEELKKILKEMGLTELNHRRRNQINSNEQNSELKRIVRSLETLVLATCLEFVIWNLEFEHTIRHEAGSQI